MTNGLLVFVQLVMAANSKSPVWMTLSSLSHSITTCFSVSSALKPKPFGPTGAVKLSWKSWATSVNKMRSCGRFGPAKAGRIVSPTVRNPDEYRLRCLFQKKNTATIRCSYLSTSSCIFIYKSTGFLLQVTLRLFAVWPFFMPAGRRWVPCTSSMCVKSPQ